MRIEPVGLSNLEQSFTKIFAQKLNQANITIADFSSFKTDDQYIPVKKIADVDLSNFNLDPNKEYFVSPEIARNLAKGYYSF